MGCTCIARPTLPDSRGRDTTEVSKTERIPGIAHVTFTDSTMRVDPMLGDAIRYVAVDSVRFRQPDEPEATLVFVRDDANERSQGIESMGAGLGQSMARVSAVDALGSLWLAALWVAGLVLSLVAMMFGALRWVVRRLRRTPASVSVSRTAWRVAACAAAFVAMQALLLSIGSEDIQALGTRTAISASLWAAGILFGLGALIGAAITWQTPAVPGRWARVSLWTVRVVTSLNVVAATYLTLGGGIGWRTWV